MTALKQITGKKKTSIASVSIQESKSHSIVINGIDAKKYLSSIKFGIESFLLPFEKAGLDAKNFIIKVIVRGGGLSSQIDAIRHAVAKSITVSFPETRQLIKSLGFLTRDPRIVERKKTGLRKARRREQFSKR